MKPIPDWKVGLSDAKLEEIEGWARAYLVDWPHHRRALFAKQVYNMAGELRCRRSEERSCEERVMERESERITLRDRLQATIHRLRSGFLVDRDPAAGIDYESLEDTLSRALGTLTMLERVLAREAEQKAILARLSEAAARALWILKFHAIRCPLNPMANRSGMEEHLAMYRQVIDELRQCDLPDMEWRDSRYEIVRGPQEQWHPGIPSEDLESPDAGPADLEEGGSVAKLVAENAALRRAMPSALSLRLIANRLDGRGQFDSQQRRWRISAAAERLRELADEVAKMEVGASGNSTQV